MNPRSTINKLQTTTKSDYAVAKHIPNATALKPIPPEDKNSTIPIAPTASFNIAHTQK